VPVTAKMTKPAGMAASNSVAVPKATKSAKPARLTSGKGSAHPARPTKSASVVRMAVQDTPPPLPFIPAQNAFLHDDSTTGCSDGDLEDEESLPRLNPEWTPINGLNLDPVAQQHIFFDQPTILEGIVAPATGLSATDQSTSEVSEEDIPWNHFAHDFTV